MPIREMPAKLIEEVFDFLFGDDRWGFEAELFMWSIRADGHVSHWDTLSLNQRALQRYPHFRGQTGSIFVNRGGFVLHLGDTTQKLMPKSPSVKPPFLPNSN